MKILLLLCFLISKIYASSDVIDYTVPLFLGMTYDAKNSRSGIDIFKQEWVENPDISYDQRETKTSYKIVTTSNEALDQLNVNGELSLKIKTGLVKIDGKGTYVKEMRDDNKTVEVLTTVRHISKTETLKEGATPIEGWETKYSKDVLGTHYVRTIIYGAEMIASAKFVVHDYNDVENVTGEIAANIGKEGDKVEVFANGTLSKLSKDLSNKANVQVSFFGTVPLRDIPNSVEGLEKLVANFEEHLKEVNLTDGIPMHAEIYDLSDLAEEEFPTYDKASGLEKPLDDFNERFDDLRTARYKLSEWSRSLPIDVDPKWEEQIGKLFEKIQGVMERFYETFYLLDLSTDEAEDKLQEAMDFYSSESDGSGSNEFNSQVDDLIIEMKPHVKFLEASSDTYIQYGNDRCTAPATEMLYSGMAFSSSAEHTQGMSFYECMPEHGKKAYDLEGEKKIESPIAARRYSKIDKTFDPFEDGKGKKLSETGVKCAKCYSKDSYSVAMFPAMESCPDNWKAMYHGFLMSTPVASTNSKRSEYICVDAEPAEPMDVKQLADLVETLAFTVPDSKTSLPGNYKSGAVIKCVVCALRSDQVTF